MTKNTFPLRIVHAIGLGVLVCMVAGQAQATVLLLENFDSLAPQLGNATTPGEIAARNVWTPDAPTSWTVDRSKVAGDPTAGAGVAEFEGWTFLDRDWYVATAGDQRRSEFTKAYGVVAVADADEYDDLGGPLGGTINPFRTNIFNSTLFSKQIPLSGAAANSVRVKFDSAWRPEGEQTGIVMAQFDGGAATPILTFSSINGNVNFKADALNETVDIPVNNPGGASNLTLSWQLTDAVNNWFWAIDNIQVYTGSPVADEPVMRAVIDRDTGRVAVINNTGANVSLRGYSIVSKAGAFDDAQANFFSEIDSNWIQFTDPGSGKDISEGHKTTGTIAAGATFELGNAWAKYFQDETDVEFTYLLPGSNEPVVGNLSFEGNGGNSYPFLDLNFDNTVDINDWITFRNGVGADLTGMSRAQAYRVGDLNGDLAYSPADFIIFKTEYDRVNGTGAFASISSVPEPASVLSLVTALVVGCLFRRRLTPKVILLLLAATIVMMAGPAYAQLVLINENFDNLPYGPNVEEALAGDNVWTDTPPAGWTIDDSGIPGLDQVPPLDGVVEWAGWSFANRDWWVSAAGDQRRSEFTLASGGVMVADPDEWDDAPNPDELYNAYVTTQIVPIPAAVPANKIQMRFDSSWRPEGADDIGNINNQTGTVEVSYDGGNTFTQVLKWDSLSGSPTFHGDVPNETVELPLNNPAGGGNLQLRFGLTQAYNDWWWAVDNLRVEIPADPSILEVNTTTGQVKIKGGDVIPVPINSVSITSAGGGLRPASYNGLSVRKPDSVDGPDADATVGNSDGEQWELLTANTGQIFDGFLFGSSTFDDSRAENLGAIYDRTKNTQDLVFTYSTIYGTEITGIIEYVQGGSLLGDYNGNGSVDAADYTIWKDSFGQSGQDLAADGNGNGVIDAADYTIWKDNFGNSLGAAATAAVPEPASGILGMLLAVAWCAVRKRR